MNHTQTSALIYLHQSADDLLTDFANAKIVPAFFINQMNELLNKFEAFIKENKSADVSYERSIKIDKSHFRAGEKK